MDARVSAEEPGQECGDTGCGEAAPEELAGASAGPQGPVLLAAGGERYDYIPCLNDEAEHITMLAKLVDQHTQGWGPAVDGPAQVLERAIALGAGQ